jgi:GR25 family glycosyltransferase involved in LPS biosynthesis
MNYDTYIISLKKSENLIENLKSKGLNPILFNGIKGVYATEDQLRLNISTFWNKFGPKSAIGCGLSHKLLWKKLSVAETKKDYSVIFEDDIIYDKNIDIKKKIEEALNTAPKDFDILYLGNIRLPGLTQLTKIGNVYNSSLSLATHAYIISKKGAKKLTLPKIKLFNHVDVCLQYYSWISYIKTYVIEPRLFYQTSTCSTVSTNTPNSFPNIINTILSHYYIDKHVKLSYITTVSCFRIGKFNITSSIILVGILSLYLFKNKKYFLLVLLNYVIF